MAEGSRRRIRRLKRKLRREEGEQAATGRRRWWPRVLGLLLLLVAGYLLWTMVSVVLAARTDERDQVDAVVVLGAAQYDGTPSPVLQSRLDHALALWEEGVAPTIVLTGSKQDADRFTEAYAGFRYLLEAGVPEDDMQVVTDGRSTYESLAATARVLGGEGVDSVVLVSDAYHNRRLQGIAGEVGLDATVSPSNRGLPLSRIGRETALVAVGNVVGYRRLDRFS